MFCFICHWCFALFMFLWFFYSLNFSKMSRLLLLLLLKKKKILLRRNKLLQNEKNKKKFRVHPILKQRPVFGINSLILELRLDSDRFFNYFRMSVTLFDILLHMVGPRIIKTDQFRDDVIQPSQRLALTLRFLASGDSMTSLYYSYRISKTSVTRIIRETTATLWDVLLPYVFQEHTRDNFVRVAQEFEEKWNFPHCLGAIDGKHVVIQAPENSGSLYFNYKHTHSIVLLAVADADYKFLMVDIGARGRQSDGGIFRNSNIGEQLQNGNLNIPQPDFIGSRRLVPYMLVGDEAFQLTGYMLRPYPGRGNIDLNQTRRIFNYRLSRARRVIENTFGILAAKWRIYRRPINCDVNTTVNIVKATVCLHNFIRNSDPKNHYMPKGSVDTETETGEVISGLWRRETENDTGMQDIQRLGSNTFTKNASRIRDEFADYLINEGQIPWQWNLNHG